MNHPKRKLGVNFFIAGTSAAALLSRRARCASCFRGRYLALVVALVASTRPVACALVRRRGRRRCFWVRALTAGGLRRRRSCRLPAALPRRSCSLTTGPALRRRNCGCWIRGLPRLVAHAAASARVGPGGGNLGSGAQYFAQSVL